MKKIICLLLTLFSINSFAADFTIQLSSAPSVLVVAKTPSSGFQQFTGSGTVNWPVESDDALGALNGTTFTAPSSGVYDIQSTIGTTSQFGGSDGFWYYSIIKNGSNIHKVGGYRAQANTPVDLSISRTERLNQGDTISFTIQAPGQRSIICDNDQLSCPLKIHKISD